MKQISRHDKIIELIDKHGFVDTDQLVTSLNVSPQTIRRDLNELAKVNKIRRDHGGATVPLTSENTDYTSRKNEQYIEKKKIAENVVKQNPDGATLFIDIGTTPEAIAQELSINHKD